MHVVEAVLLLVSLVLVSNVISHYLVAVPVALIQAALGLGAALIFRVQLEMATDWFMLLFTAPLLYNDGRRFPKKELWALRGPIFANAIWLVFLITFACGFFLHWLIPAMPLAACFALAAIMAPTDPIAVQSLANRVSLPSSLLHLISGESLINDASGLIGFKYGIAAAVTGSFVVSQAVGDFFFVSLIGALVGAVLMLVINVLRLWLLQQGINDVILHTVLQLVTPFLIYLLVDEVIGASGVIAVVVAGLVNNSGGNRYISALPELRIVSERTWDIVVYTLNGLIFLILGIELPVAMRMAIQSREVNTGRALLDVLLVYLVMLALRTLWTYGYMLFGALRSHTKRPHFGVALLSGLSGVRGAITLIGVLAVPLTLADGTPFPERNLMLFIAAGFVVLSLVAAVVVLPLVTKSRTPLRVRGSALSVDDTAAAAEAAREVRRITPAQAQRFLYQMAVRRLESERREQNQKPVLDLITEYQDLIRRLDRQADNHTTLPPMVQEEIELRLVGVRGELARLATLHEDTEISEKVYRRSRRQLLGKERDLTEMAQQKGRPTLHMLLDKVQLRVRHLTLSLASERERKAGRYQEQLYAEKELAKAGLKAISAYLKDPAHHKDQANRQVIYALIVQYRNRIASVKALTTHKSVQYERESQRLRAIALAAERAAIHDLLEQGYIGTSLAQKLNQTVNYTENAADLTELEEL
ncbi:cation:proton antiporter [Lacticaseibacillus daqingensis]|uniref:cation:proton antiporter n=1 Tax=Lacticaseibacillus daqingensis TaxID=2486014 RepID=UPI000F7844BE|nr:sodium:proton antiporter [Lacticaseibacillus daqingensis]